MVGVTSPESVRFSASSWPWSLGLGPRDPLNLNLRVYMYYKNGYMKTLKLCDFGLP
jgi:hypothetical protein